MPGSPQPRATKNDMEIILRPEGLDTAGDGSLACLVLLVGRSASAEDRKALVGSQGSGI